MKKLRLSLDALAVESFDANDTFRHWAGTVEARDDDTDASNCPTCDTCQGDNCKKCGCADSTLV
jgi:hypothetical protein